MWPCYKSTPCYKSQDTAFWRIVCPELWSFMIGNDGLRLSCSETLWVTPTRLWLHSFLSCSFFLHRLTLLFLKWSCGAFFSNFTDLSSLFSATVEWHKSISRSEIEKSSLLQKKILSILEIGTVAQSGVATLGNFEGAHCLTWFWMWRN